MPTLVESQPEVRERPAGAITPTEARPGWVPALANLAKASPRPLFSDSLLESELRERRRRGLATTVSFTLQCALLGVLLVLPLMFTEALPSQQLLTFLVAPPPPPPPPPPAAAPVTKIVQTDMLNNGELRTPTRIPRKIEMIREEEAPPPALSGGVVGGVPGGIPGGQLGGVIGGIISASSNPASMIPKLEPVKRIRVSQGVSQGMVIRKIDPVYPKLALAARVTGVVLLKAVIDRQGAITEVQVISGHPILVPAAIEAVKQWRYRPYSLNGEPVEVETNITVTFQISN
jgi:protein TonB